MAPSLLCVRRIRQNREWEMHQQLPNREEKQPNPQHYKNDLPSMGKMKPATKNVEMKDTGKTLAAPKSPNVKENGEENEKRGCIAEWHTFLDTFLAKEVRTHFSKNGSLPNSNFFSHTLPIPCNN